MRMENVQVLVREGEERRRLISGDWYYHIRKPIHCLKPKEKKKRAIIACSSEICTFSYWKTQFKTILSDVSSCQRRRNNFKPNHFQWWISCDSHLDGSHSSAKLLREMSLAVVEALKSPDDQMAHYPIYLPCLVFLLQPLTFTVGSEHDVPINHFFPDKLQITTVIPSFLFGQWCKTSTCVSAHIA